MPRRFRHTPSTQRLASLIALVALAASATGCITRPIKETVFNEAGTEIKLRSYKRGLTTVSQGYDHPATIAPVRMAHILSRIDLRREDDPARVPAIPLALLYRMADGMSQALAKANPDQQVVVQALRKKKSLLVFDHFYLTALMAYMRDEVLYIHVSHSDRELESRDLRPGKQLPETRLGVYPRPFRLVVDEGMTLYDQQSVAVAWRDDIFRKPTRTRITSTGKVVRRQVLMESFEDESLEPKTPTMSSQLTPQQLRDLADLEEDRQNGQVSETQYQARRRRILSGESPEP